MGKNSKQPSLDELLREGASIKRDPPTVLCELCADPVVCGYCVTCGGPFERFAVIWKEAMATSSQRLDAAAMRYLIHHNKPQSAVEKELSLALENWIEARRMKGVSISTNNGEVSFG